MKKILSLVLALLMSASAASLVGAAEEAAIAPEDTLIATDTAAVDAAEAEAQAQYADALALLGSWNILHGKGENNPAAADPIKRYEMALFVSRISTGWTDDSKWAVADQWYDRDHDTSGFDDLEGSGAINVYGALSYASQKGIILGYGNRKFGPEDGITYQDALTMAVRTLGYYNLSWPWGNIEKAVTLGLTVGIPSSVKYTDILNRGQVAQIIYNALFATTKDGDTLAARNFNGDLDWKSIIITVAGKNGHFLANDPKANVPESVLLPTQQRLGFKVVNKDGTLSEDTYWVKTSQIPGLGFTLRLENYLGYAYRALFSKDADSNYVTVEWMKPVQADTVINWGDKSVKGEFPIYDYLKDTALRSVFSFAGNTYLNTWNGNYGWKEAIIMNALQTSSYQKRIGNKYGVDWTVDGKGDILERTTEADADLKYTVDIDGKPAYFKVAWYWNDTINAYFRYVYKDAADGTKSVVGIDILDQKDIDAMLKDLDYTETAETYKGLVQFTGDSIKNVWKTAYAYLTPFTLNDASAPNYGLFEEFSFGLYTPYTDNDDSHGPKRGFKIERLNDVSVIAADLFATAKNINGVAGLNDKDFNGLYNTKWQKQTVASGLFEDQCDHSGKYWYNDEAGLPEPSEASYVIYSYDKGTGEIKIVKIIYDISNEKSDDDNFVATGVVRAYNIEKRTVTIGDKPYSFDYDCLKDAGLQLLKPGDKDKRAEFTYLFKSLFNQYVTYVVVDGKLVHIEPKGATADLIVVDSYAGLSSDGYIVINGWDTENLQYRQYKIGSYNGWVKGDYYYYPDQARVDGAFERGTLYKIISKDASNNDEIFYVTTVALAELYDDYRDYTNVDSDKYLSGLYDLDELVEKKIVDADKTAISLEAGYRKIAKTSALATTDWEKGKSAHKYILICNPIGRFQDDNNGVEGKIWHDLASKPQSAYVYGNYAPIIVYKGVGPTAKGASWYAEGWKVNGIGHDTTVLVNVDFDQITGWDRDQYGISYVLFLTYEYEYADYNGNYADGWYLLGATTARAQCFNFYNGEISSYTVVNKDLKRGYAYPAMNGYIIDDEVRYDACTLVDLDKNPCDHSVNGAITAAYQSGSHYLFGHSTFSVFDKLWSKADVSKEILSARVVTNAPAGFKVGDLLDSDPKVFMVDTEEELDSLRAGYDNYGKHLKFKNVENISADEFKIWAEKLEKTTLSYWWIYDRDKKTIVFYIQKDGVTLETIDTTIAAKSAIVVETAKTEYDLDTALIKATANVTETLRDDVINALKVKSLVFKFDDNKKDDHGFTITGEDHNAIFLDSFEFGDNHECTKNDWNTAVTYDGDTDNYVRVVGTLETETYDPHAEEVGCEMIKAVKVVLPDGGKTIKFPTAASAKDADGNFVETTTILCNFKDIDRNDKEEVYQFEVFVTVACTFAEDGTIATSAVTFDYTVKTSQLAGDNNVRELLVQ